MKKGTISVEKTKKGFKITLVMDNGKIQSPSYKGFTEEFIKDLPQNKNVFYELKDGGALDIVSLDSSGKEIIFQFKIIEPVIMPQKGLGDNYGDRNNAILSINSAHAPYNFIPVNEQVVKSPIEVDKIRFNIFDIDQYTGFIDLNLEALTPLYIRGMNKAIQGSADKNPDFFNGKKYCIPGSSLRGAIRAMLEIVSYSKMGSINKNTFTQRYHYRAFADQSLTLREEYSSKMLASEGNPLHYFPKISAGVIKKEGHNYFIHPGRHFKVEEELIKSKSMLPELMSYESRDRYKANKSYEIGFKSVYFKAEPETIHTEHSKNLKYAKVTEISENNKSQDLIPGFLIHSGWMIGPKERNKGRGKHMHWIIGSIDYTKKIKIAEEVIENYCNDKLRDSIDLIGMLDNKKAGLKEVPCFYIVNQSGIVTSFGYTGMFRLAYDRTLIDFFPKGHRAKTPDFAEVMFGKNDVVPGRICVEDAFLQEGCIFDKIRIPAILGSPKPTTFQHYLKQNKNLISTALNNSGKVSGYRGIVDYNQEGTINGYKLYWHQKSINYPSHIEISESVFKKFLAEQHLTDNFPTFDGQNNKIKFTICELNKEQHEILIRFILTQDKVQYTAIRPILAGAKFAGRIRFENLSEIEFGALMFVLSLPDNLCYKIGMGKALGFGSIKINPKIYISDRKERYSNLISEWLDNAALLSETIEAKVTKSKKAFENFMLEQINSKSTSLWDEERMKELKVMLDFGNSVSGVKSEFMLINKPIEGQTRTENEYKSRPILPTPTEYIKTK